MWRIIGERRARVIDVPVRVMDVLADRTIEGAVGNLAVWIDRLNRRVERLVALSDSVWVGDTEGRAF